MLEGLWKVCEEWQQLADVAGVGSSHARHQSLPSGKALSNA
jgi:hypothetical protein